MAREQRERGVGREQSPAQLKPTSLDIGLLVWQLFPVPACSIHETEQWGRTKEQSPGSPTCLPPLLPTSSGNQHKVKLFQKDPSCINKTFFCWQHVARSQTFAGNAKPQGRKIYFFLIIMLLIHFHINKRGWHWPQLFLKSWTFDKIKCLPLGCAHLAAPCPVFLK